MCPFPLELHGVTQEFVAKIARLEIRTDGIGGGRYTPMVTLWATLQSPPSIHMMPFFLTSTAPVRVSGSGIAEGSGTAGGLVMDGGRKRQWSRGCIHKGVCKEESRQH